MPELTYQQKEIQRVIEQFPQSELDAGFHPSLRVYGLDVKSKNFNVTMTQLKQIQALLADPRLVRAKFTPEQVIADDDTDNFTFFTKCRQACADLDEDVLRLFDQNVSAICEVTQSGIESMLSSAGNDFWELEPIHSFCENDLKEFMQEYAPEGYTFGEYDFDDETIGFWKED